MSLSTMVNTESFAIKTQESIVEPHVDVRQKKVK
jgi:hypothetical protein